MIFKHLLVLMGLSCLVVFSGVSRAQVVATVGGKKITLKEFRQRYEEVLHKSINPPPPNIFLEDLVRYELGVQEAKKHKLENDPLVKEQLRQDMYKALLEKELGQKVSNIKVTEKEMKKYYERSPDLRTSHILIEFPANATSKQKALAMKRAEEAYKDVKSGKRTFAEYAKLYSDDVISKNNGGDVGYQNRITLVPNYYETALKMRVGQVSRPIETRFGYHIIKLTGRRSFNEVTDKRPIRAGVFDSKRKILFDAYFKNLKGKYKIRTFPGVLSAAKFK